MISVVVFTRDLRVMDNPALSAAIANSAAIVPVFVLDEPMLARIGHHANRLGFLLESLADLDDSLRARGGALIVRRGPWTATVIDTARAVGAATIHLAEDVSGYAQRRLAELKTAAARCRLSIATHPGITVVPPGAIRPSGAAAYQVFTPYYRRWLEAPRRPVFAAPKRITLPPDTGPGQLPQLDELATTARAAVAVRGGESSGLRRAHQWAWDHLGGYAASRDDLAADQTSRLSPYLHFGCISPLALTVELADHLGAAAFMRQIAWRDFFHQLLAARPDAAWANFRNRAVDWHDDPGALQAWQAGQTGYPVVDAAMRQLAAEGFMPGRARMVVASFLTKDLHLDWRSGARHFLRHLVDADVACNQLNWQWVAGTGTDTNPRRIFNPTVQGRKYDPDGSYIRRHLPELADLPADRIHAPAAADRRACRYPAPMVDHAEAIAALR